MGLLKRRRGHRSRGPHFWFWSQGWSFCSRWWRPGCGTRGLVPLWRMVLELWRNWIWGFWCRSLRWEGMRGCWGNRWQQRLDLEERGQNRERGTGEYCLEKVLILKQPLERGVERVRSQSQTSIGMDGFKFQRLLDSVVHR